jgi:hypothetical protein
LKRHDTENINYEKVNPYTLHSLCSAWLQATRWNQRSVRHNNWLEQQHGEQHPKFDTSHYHVEFDQHESGWLSQSGYGNKFRNWQQFEHGHQHDVNKLGQRQPIILFLPSGSKNGDSAKRAALPSEKRARARGFF